MAVITDFIISNLLKLYTNVNYGFVRTTYSKAVIFKSEFINRVCKEINNHMSSTVQDGIVCMVVHFMYFIVLCAFVLKSTRIIVSLHEYI